MSVAKHLREGWCPGALRPMRVGDGLLVRVKPRGNRLSIVQARAVAEASSCFGNGILNITGRANLQLRGVADGTLPPLQDALSRAGLLDASPEGEAARNVLSGPLAGPGATAPFDVRASVAALEEALARDAGFRRLPAKFNWSVDDDGPLGFDAVPSDVAFTATRFAGEAGFRVALAGGGPVAAWAPGDLVRTAAALADGFLALCDRLGIEPHRMSDLVAVAGAAAVFAQAGLPTHAAPPTRPAISPIGPLSLGGSFMVGVAPAFGRLEAGALDGFARVAGRLGAVAVNLTPWRGMLVGGLPEGATAPLLQAAAARGFIIDPADPRLAVAACAGAPACKRAGAPVQDHATAWARLLGPAASTRTVLHVSGCAKGCAHGTAAPLTLVARAGLYDLVRGGRAGDPPRSVGLPVEAVVAILAGGIGTAAEAGA